MLKVLKKIINKFFSIFKIDDKKIVFQGNQNMVDGNPRAIYEYMKKSNPEYRLICIVNKGVNTSFIPKKDCVYYKTLKSYFHLSTAKYWIRSQSFGGLIEKRKGQVYIQTWHGHGALKKMSYDIDALNNIDRNVELEHVRDWDYFISTDKLDGDVIISSTNYKGKIVELGAPSLDQLINDSNNQEKIKNIKQEIGITNDNRKKIILYAPTFRDSDLDSKKVDVKIESLKNLKDYIILIRLHPLVEKKIDKKIFSKNFINVCDYYDVSNLLLITDVLISDYSSIVYEFGVLDRPMIFYAYDYDLYAKERGFYIEYNTLPGIIVKEEKELLNVIKSGIYESDEFNIKRSKFNKKYNKLNDGNATKRFVDLLVKGYFNESR